MKELDSVLFSDMLWEMSFSAPHSKSPVYEGSHSDFYCLQVLHLFNRFVLVENDRSLIMCDRS